MTRDMKKLLRELDLPEGWPAVDAKAVKRRVNAALNADPSERKAYMRQKIKLAAVLVAAVVALTGTALAVTGNIDALQAFFKGDTSSAQRLVDGKPRTVSDKDFSFTVESSASDEQNAYLVVRVDALNTAAAEKLVGDGFENMDTFSFYPVDDPGTTPPEDIDVDKTNGVHIAGVAPMTISSWGVRESKDAKTDTSRTWMVDVALREETVASTLRARLGYMEADQFVEVPLTPAEAVTVKIGAYGQGSPTYWSRNGGPLTINQVILSPFTCRVDVTVGHTLDTEPRIFFRMADGTLRTQSQMMSATNGGGDSYSYRFFEVLDLNKVTSLVVFDREYPLDGSPSRPVTYDPALDTFEVPLMSPLSEEGGYTLPVRALSEGLGGVCTWDNATQTATLTYRDVSIALTLGSKTALVNGGTVQLDETPGAEDGKLTADYKVFYEQWGIDLFTFVDKSKEDRPRICWIVIP